jgi:hypothetical protein
MPVLLGVEIVLRVIEVHASEIGQTDLGVELLYYRCGRRSGSSMSTSRVINITSSTGFQA